MTRSNRFFLAIVLQVVVICAIAIFKLSIVSGGTEVLVHIRPVDPRDLLRGDYITFQYDISTVRSYYYNSEIGAQLNEGRTVYVELARYDKYWTAKYLTPERPSDGTLYIKGVVKSVDGDSVRVAYGAEEYFIPEGVGRNFNFGNKDAAAALAIDENGNAVLKRIYIDGKSWP